MMTEKILNLSQRACIVANWCEEKSFPPLAVFAEFLQKEAGMANDPVLAPQAAKHENGNPGVGRSDQRQKTIVSEHKHKLVT